MPRRTKNKKQGNSGRGSQLPPQFKSDVVIKHRFRYQSNGASAAVNITRKDLLNCLFMSSNGLGQNYRLCAAARLKRVEIWGMGGSSNVANATTTISAKWHSQYAPSTEISDTGTIYKMAHLSTSPPAQSLAGFWSLTGNNETEVLLTLQIDQGYIVDLWLDLVLNDGEAAVLNNTTATGATGVTYEGYADASSTKLLFPVSYGSLI